MQMYKLCFRSFFLFTAILLNAYGTHAQETKNTDSIKKVQQLQAVEIRAVRATTDAPFAKRDISGADLEKQNLGVDLPILLQYTPSVVTTSDAGAGVGYTSLSIRGSDPTRINVTMNGMPVNDPEEQAVYFVDLPDLASTTSSIQVQRGVGTSTNGAGAFGATISISNLAQMDTAGAIFSSSAGSFNTWKNTLVAGTGMLKNGWQFDIRLSKISSDGYIQRATSDLRSIQFIAGWKASEKTWLHFMVLTGIEKTGQAWDGVPQDSLQTNRTYNELGLKSDGTFYSNQTDNYQQDYYQLFADHKFSPYLTGHIGFFMTRGLGYYEEYHNQELLNSYGITNTTDTLPTDLIRQLWLNNYYYGSVFSLLYEKNKTQLTLGGGWTQFDNSSYGIIKWVQNGGVPNDYEWYNYADHKNDINIYAKWQQKIGSKFILFADMQDRILNWHMGGFQYQPSLVVNESYNFLNPKAGFTYLLKNEGSQRQKIYASIAVANREPVHDDFQVDPANLPKPETLYDIEAGYEINKQKWSASANLYYMDYHDQLVLTGQLDSVGNAIHTNVAKSYRAGIELQGVVLASRWLKLQANATFSQNKIVNFTEYLYDENYVAYAIPHGTTDISYSPDIIAAGTATFTPFHKLPKGQGLEINISDKYISKQYLDNTSNNERAISAYSYCNVLICYTVKVRPFKELDATLQLNNIFNQYYSNNGATYPSISQGVVSTVNYYFPQAGFNMLGGITLKW